MWSFLNPKWPYLGASPDGVVTCSCFSKGVVEIKCLFCHRNDAIVESSDDKQFCLKKDSNNCLQLDHLHAYYYQVQTQIFVCEVDYCDFVVCTFPEDQSKPDIHIERIFPNESFWSERMEQSTHFFRFVFCLKFWEGGIHGHISNEKINQTLRKYHRHLNIHHSHFIVIAGSPKAVNRHGLPKIILAAI